MKRAALSLIVLEPNGKRICSDLIIVNVRCIGGDICATLSMKKSSTGLDVKVELERSTGVPAIYQQLLLDSSTVQDGDSMSSLAPFGCSSLLLTLVRLC